MIASRDNKSFSQIANLAMEEFVSNHLDGNEQYTLDHPLIATPALFRDYPTWATYYNHLLNNEEEKHRFKLQELLQLHYKRFGVKI